jgi:hypothetical protein
LCLPLGLGGFSFCLVNTCLFCCTLALYFLELTKQFRSVVLFVVIVVVVIVVTTALFSPATVSAVVVGVSTNSQG